MCSSKDERTSSAISPRGDIPEWKWKGSLAAIFLTTIINGNCSGYDVSNVANIQPRLYEAFGNITLLPWISLSFSLANFAALSFSRKILYCFEMRWVYLASIIVFMAGAAVAGAAQNMASVIVGRIIMGVGGAVVYQRFFERLVRYSCLDYPLTQDSNLTFVAVFATPTETPRLLGVLGALWAVGIVIGGPIGSAFAANEHATWRWALYLNLPWAGLGLLVVLICFPRKYLGPDISVAARIAAVDPIGIVLNLAAPILLALALEFSGPIWAWGSAASIACWVVFGVVLVAWGVQQYWCIGTSPSQRAIPVHLLTRVDLLPLWIASGCAGASYAVTLYYLPLFFAFTRGYSALEQTVHLLPFILVFIAVVMSVGGLLPVFGRYNIIYIVAGSTTLAGASVMVATLSPGVSDAQVLGLEALIGVGLGCSLQHGVGISNVINQEPWHRVDSAALFNMAQMGGIAIALAAAGPIFQNVGYDMLVDAVGDDGYSQKDLREALAGVSSMVWQSSDPEIVSRGVEAVAGVIAREWYLVVAGGAACLVCGVLMRWERLDYGRQMDAENKG
ncbi:major facilitator superfamily domain-containing protein [Aspergillus floccosus]